MSLGEQGTRVSVCVGDGGGGWLQGGRWCVGNGNGASIQKSNNILAALGAAPEWSLADNLGELGAERK